MQKKAQSQMGEFLSQIEQRYTRSHSAKPMRALNSLKSQKQNNTLQPIRGGKKRHSSKPQNFVAGKAYDCSDLRDLKSLPLKSLKNVYTNLKLQPKKELRVQRSTSKSRRSVESLDSRKETINLMIKQPNTGLKILMEESIHNSPSIFPRSNEKLLPRKSKSGKGFPCQFSRDSNSRDEIPMATLSQVDRLSRENDAHFVSPCGEQSRVQSLSGVSGSRYRQIRLGQKSFQHTQQQSKVSKKNLGFEHSHQADNVDIKNFISTKKRRKGDRNPSKKRKGDINSYIGIKEQAEDAALIESVQ